MPLFVYVATGDVPIFYRIDIHPVMRLRGQFQMKIIPILCCVTILIVRSYDTIVVMLSLLLLKVTQRFTSVTLYFLSREATPTFCVEVLSGAVTPYLPVFALSALMYYLGRCPLIKCDCHLACIYYRGRSPLAKCDCHCALIYYRGRCPLTKCDCHFALLY